MEDSLWLGKYGKEGNYHLLGKCKIPSYWENLGTILKLCTSRERKNRGVDALSHVNEGSDFHKLVSY